MTDARTLLAAALGLLLGFLCLFAPEAVVRTQTVGRRPGGRGGEYGDDAVPARWRRLVQALGGGCLLLGLYFGYTALG
jgi:hypothetical protein